MTNFCLSEVELNFLDEKITIFIDGNSKITRDNGTYAEPNANCFSLPPISTCPGATKECMASCYVQGLQQFAPEVFEKYRHNEQMIHKMLILNDYHSYNISRQFGEWISENCKGGFRWHVSGDVFSRDYAQWITDVCYYSKNVEHWIYTRSFWAINRFVFDCENLTVNLSADASNIDKALRCYNKYDGLRICYLTRDGHVPDLPGDYVIFPDYPLRGRELEKPTEHHWFLGLTQEQKKHVCPTDFFGQSETNRCGPCDKCLKKGA